MADWDEIQKLLLKWEMRRLSYFEQIQKTEDLERAKTIMAMDFQLGKCIEELHELAENEGHILTRRIMAGIENVQKENNESK